MISLFTAFKSKIIAVALAIIAMLGAIIKYQRRRGKKQAAEIAKIKYNAKLAKQSDEQNQKILKFDYEQRLKSKGVADEKTLDAIDKAREEPDVKDGYYHTNV